PTENPSADASNTNLAANNKPPADPPVVMQPVSDIQPATTREREVKQPDTTVAKIEQPIYVPSAPPTVKEEKKPAAETPKNEAPTTETPKTSTTIDVGSLVAYATKQTPPVYPPQARTMRTTGLVTVQVTVNEAGDVDEVQKTSGPPMLQNAAKDAI